MTMAPVVRMSGAFGSFQFIMPIAGWMVGRTVAGVLAGYGCWIAFGLLAYIGAKMIAASFRKNDRPPVTDPTKGWTLLTLAVATSLDALAVGLGFAFLKVSIVQASIVIGVATSAMTAAGMALGGTLERLAGKRVETLGGLILIGAGLKVLLDHFH
jgi:putative Mn2+ efflux pump MntP